MKRREAKSKGEKERYTHLNAEFKASLRIRTKKQRKIIEWETRDPFKKISDTMGPFHAKMSSEKDRNGIDLTEAEDIKRWQEYTDKLYKKKSS